jgi:hypothetical protein
MAQAWKPPPRPASLVALLKSESFTVGDVLDDPFYAQCLQSGSKLLVEYLVKDGTIDGLLDWALTCKHDDHPRLSKCSRMAVSALISSNPRIQKSVLHSPIFAARLQAFPDNPDRSNPRVAANFAAIVQDLTRATKGEFMASLQPSLTTFVLSHMVVLSTREFFVKLVLEFTKEFEVSVPLMEAVCEQQDLAPVVAGICEVVKQRALAVSYLNSDKVVRTILGLAVSTDDIITAVETFELIDRLFLRYPITLEWQATIEELYERYRPKFDRPPDGQTAFALTVLRRAPNALLARILDLPANTFLSRGVLEAFRAMPEAEREDVASELGLARRIMEVLPKTVANGYLTDLAWLLVCQDCPEFAEFHETVVKQRIEGRTMFIGAQDEQKAPVEADVPDIVFHPGVPDDKEDEYDSSEEDDIPGGRRIVTVVMPPVPAVAPPEPPGEEEVVEVAVPDVRPPDEETVVTVVVPIVPDVEPPDEDE